MFDAAAIPRAVVFRKALPLLVACLLAFSFSRGALGTEPLADLRLPSKNYINNGGFERGEEGWSPFAGKRAGGVVTGEAHSGQSCYKVTGVIDDYRYLNQYAVPLTPAHVYTLSAWMKCAGFKRAGENSQLLNLTNYGWTQAAQIGPKKTDEGWTKYSVTFKAPPTQDLGAGPVYTLVIFWPVKSEGTVWVDDIQIEEGDQPTDFTDLYFGWAFDALSTLRTVCQNAEDARANLATNFRDFPVAKTLSAKATDIIAKANALAERLKTFATLSITQAQTLPREAEALQKDAASLRFIYYPGNPCLPLSEVSLPESDAGDMSVTWTCLAGERRALAINVANLTGRAVVTRIVPGELYDVTRQTRVVGLPWITSYSAPEIRGHVRPTQLFTDPMPRSDEAGDFFIGNGKINQAVLVFDTTALLPGEYHGSVVLSSLADAADKRKLDVKLTVVPVRLATITNLDVCDVGQMAEYAFDSIRPLGINTFTVPSQWLIPEFDPTGKGNVRVDFTRVAGLMRDYLKRCPEARFFLGFGVGSVISEHLKQVYGLTLEAPLFKVFAANWAKEVVKHFAALGVGPERMIFETVDEPGHAGVPEAVAWAEIIKAAEPKAKTASYVTSLNFEDKDCARLYETHDIVGPGFSSVNEESVARLKKMGKKVWVYDCQNGAETFHSIAYYRLLPWLAWKHGLDGWGHFSWLNSERGRDYVPWEGVAEESLVYPNLRGGQVISRRWLALSAGIQDYQALLALKRLVTAAKQESNRARFAGIKPEIVSRAEKMLNDMPAKALSLLKPGNRYFMSLVPGADATTLEQFREEIAAATGELAAALKGANANVEATLITKEGRQRVAVSLPASGAITVRYLCDHQLPWYTESANVPAGKSEILLPTGSGKRVSRCLIQAADDNGIITVFGRPPLPKIEVDTTLPPYNQNALNDGLAMPGMKYEPEHGWISSGAATEHWVVASLDQPRRVSKVRLWWMTFGGLPQAYKVQVWVDNAWKDAPGFADWRAAPSAVEEITFSPVLTDKVRILQKSGGGIKTSPNLMGLSEVEVN